MIDKADIAVNQYLTFTLDGDLFALDIASVREVLEYVSVTRIPRTPEFMRGVINLRGQAVPVVDLRLKFGMPRTEVDVNTCIIIVEAMVSGELTVMGALADSVREVVEIEPAAVEPPPRMGTRIDTTFIRGMARRDDLFVVVLDINRVFSEGELTAIRDTGQPEKGDEQAA